MLPERLRDCHETIKMDASEVPDYQWVCHVQEKSMHLKTSTMESLQMTCNADCID